VAFQNYWSELVGTVPRLDLGAAQAYINRAWRDIREARLWSWLTTEGVLLAPQLISLGTVTTTQFLNTVTLDATANAALNNLANPPITQRQFRVGVGGRVYNITGYNNGSSQLTLDGVFMEPSGAGQDYMVYRCYYTPADLNGNTITDFQTFEGMLNYTEGYAIVGANLRMSKAEIDARDPQRGAFDNAYQVAHYKVDGNGNPIYELWPHPTVQAPYLFLARRRGVPLSSTVDIPATLSPDLLVTRGLFYAYDWAIANAGRFAELKGVDFQLLKAENQRTYDKMLNDARRHDDEIFLDSYVTQWRDYLTTPPIDADFMQDHDLGMWA
jgi:hypothetical protein